MSTTREIARLTAIILLGTALIAALILRGQSPVQQPSIGSTPSGAPEDPNYTPAPEASTDTTTAPCAGDAYQVKQVYADRSDPTIANRAEASTRVVIGTATMEKAVWNTDSGAKPALSKEGWLPATAMIYQPVSISVQTDVRGSGEQTFTARWLGGQVGCEIAGIDGGTSIDIAKGKTYAFFLAPSTNADGARTMASLTVLEAWPVEADGSITTPLEGKISSATFDQKVDAARLSPLSP